MIHILLIQGVSIISRFVRPPGHRRIPDRYTPCCVKIKSGRLPFDKTFHICRPAIINAARKRRRFIDMNIHIVKNDIVDLIF